MQSSHPQSRSPSTVTEGYGGTLSPHLTWRFAAVATVAAIGVSFATQDAGTKVSMAVFAVVYGGFAADASFLTRSNKVQAIVPFVLSA